MTILEVLSLLATRFFLQRLVGRFETLEECEKAYEELLGKTGGVRLHIYSSILVSFKANAGMLSDVHHLLFYVKK